MSDLPPLVLVTGGTSSIVRTTIRDNSRICEVHTALSHAEIPKRRLSSVEFETAGLLDDAGWDAAMEGVDCVLFFTSPLLSPVRCRKTKKKSKSLLLLCNAVQGTKRVLRAAGDAGVKRVVVTKPALVSAYPKSKTLAERAAWEVLEEATGEESDSQMELVAINPVNVYGPILDPEGSTTLRSVGELLDDTVPGIPRINWGVVDVRDVADLHVLAMTHPDAPRNRFICIGEGTLMGE
ncbi:uncharacterized protein BDV17DRAFT_286902 [Aspergillus undulatus]|uniref:uncharacterized protein n=1 Tax=Aspergillus undulatus TaxID=1810928 RepID=UPI003CCDE92A